MIILESIRLRNFRAIREAVFKPKLDGITGILGATGAGKTTFLAGTLFALFGTKPPNASISSLRRTEADKNEECSASVVFQHLGQTVEIIRELKGNNNRVVVDIYVDGAPQTVTSVGAADTWIAQRLGVDSAGFLTAFIVRQKELDKLVTARPAERKAIIEKLAGIDTINEALKKSRKDESTAKAILETLPGSETKIDEAESQVHLLSNKVNELVSFKEGKQAELNILQDSVKTLNSEIESMRSAEANMLKIRSEISNLETSVEADQNTVERLNYVVNVDSEFDIDVLRAQHMEVNANLSKLTQQLNASRVVKAQLDDLFKTFSFSVNDLENKTASSTISLEDKENIELTIEHIKNSIVELKQNNAVYANKAEDYQEKAKALSGEHKECPTCNTLLDDVEKLVADFESLAKDFEQKQLDNLEKINQLHVELKAKTDEQNKIVIFFQQKAKLDEDTQSLDDIRERISVLPDLSLVEVEIEKLEEVKERVTENGLKVKRFNEDKVEFDKANNNLTVKTKKISELYPALTGWEKQFSEENYSAARSKLDKTQKDFTNLSSRMNETYSELSGFESKLSVANNNLRSAVEQWKRKKDLLHAQERKALTTELIDKFRQDSIASLAPELSEHATTLISSITSGAFTEIRLDDNFGVTVVNSSGEERDVGWLSGGEESAVAFALRLAIAFLITGGNPSLLWLDEVLTSQDAERRASMLATINNLPIDQIIMINHTDDQGDIVDKTVTVIPDIINGSILSSDDGANVFVKSDDMNDEAHNPVSPSSLDDIEDDLSF